VIKISDNNKPSDPWRRGRRSNSRLHRDSTPDQTGGSKHPGFRSTSIHVKAAVDFALDLDWQMEG